MSTGSTGIPEKIGRYQILERVGKGGMGVLFRGVDEVLDREVAIKLMLVDFSSDAEEMRPRFYREARSAAKLQHPNIVTVFEFAEENGTPYIVMEFLRGESLAARMASPLPLTLDDKLNIVAQLCTALNYAHEQGVVHRDVKPPNVFILPDGTVKLLDFGVAKLTSSTLTRQGTVLGSASYMSPEQVAGAESVDGRSDIFSVGVVLYELLAGRKPFQGDSPTAIVMKILSEEPPPLDELAPGLPPPLLAAVKRALAKNPADRFATAGDLARELQIIRKSLKASDSAHPAFEETRFASQAELDALQKGLAAARQGSAAPIPAPAAASTGTSKPKWMLPAAIGAVVVAGGVAFLLFGRGSGEASTPASATASAPAPAAAGAGTVARVASHPAAAGKASVQVSSEPSGAAIAIDGDPTTETTPATVTLDGSGSHRLRLTKAGFADRDVTVTAADIARGSVSYTLKSAEVATVPVSVSSVYPVALLDGTHTISPEGESHQVNVAAGTTLHVVSTKYFLDVPLKVEGKAVTFETPALGSLTVRSNLYGNCSATIGRHSLGDLPINKWPIAVGEYRVDLVCPNGENPVGQRIVIEANKESRVGF